jgi:hypothetical protein
MNNTGTVVIKIKEGDDDNQLVREGGEDLNDTTQHHGYGYVERNSLLLKY